MWCGIQAIVDVYWHDWYCWWDFDDNGHLGNHSIQVDTAETSSCSHCPGENVIGRLSAYWSGGPDLGSGRHSWARKCTLLYDGLGVPPLLLVYGAIAFVFSIKGKC